MKTYVERFDDGPRGWFQWNNAPGASALDVGESVATSRGPWWTDYNHAPPGGGYLHILFALMTTQDSHVRTVAGPNRFIEGGFPTDFTNARITLRTRGEVDLKGSQLVLLVQSNITEPMATRVNSVLTGQPVPVTRDWTETTLTCVPDNAQWTCLGSRSDRFATYGWGPIVPVLRNVTCDIIFVLFPLDVQPATPITGDRHVARAGLDYPLDAGRLPSGYVSMDEIRIEFPESVTSR